jgi:hypothetical protein
MNLNTITLLLIVALQVILTAATSLKPTESTNLRGLAQVTCQTDDDCSKVQEPCTKKWCPPVKICINNKCRNPKIFEKCGTNVCNQQKGEGCCDAECGICGTYSTTPKKFLLCPKIACIPSRISAALSP